MYTLNDLAELLEHDELPLHSPPQPQSAVYYDNLTFGDPPTELLESSRGATRFLADNLPIWLTVALSLSQ
jgi:hypothetical protein